ncbi:MAG: YhjD/YihY/BrkB family envelope integrity protein [Streptosporangiaceae bacterium]
MSDDPGDQHAGEADRDVTAFRRLAEATQLRLGPVRQWLARYEHLPVVDVIAGTYRRDRESAGPVLGSAIAFRLFLFFVPFLVLVVGIAGFASGFVDARAVSSTAGVSGSLGAQISEAFHQPEVTRWFAVLIGLFGVLTAGRSLSRVLRAASAAAWRLPLTGTRSSLRTAGGVAGLICGMALIAILVNRVREDLGLGVAGLAFVPALVIYGLAWLGVSMMLPRVTDDPGALLPGSLLVALTITVMHAISEFYLPDRLGRASQLYGAIGTTVVTLGWFFILGRGIVLAMELNAAVYERYGSISQVVFSLPFFRVLARRSARVRSFFGLQ